ncbi:hypothetical protein Clacol_003859 [Clathrus columnatus]|uniref:Uncharacterized protein n=1 Tax=Clathrus columnatus TaxID=1419009 RepID=A0AAV5A9M9_9AGAM|nr:hypothetical protein Clacol_003859 [Clathrus columnatus]
MDVIPIASISTNSTDESFDPTTSQTMQHLLIPSICDPNEGSSKETILETISFSTQQSYNNLPVDPSLTTVLTQQATTSGPTEYTAQVPYNPNRPPPYTYQRQHEFPPFPPLTRHPVLPFLTTAFADQDQLPSAQPSKQQRTPVSTRALTGQRNIQSQISTIPTMDVNKNDPTAIFIRPPFVVPHPPEGEEGAAAVSISENEHPLPGTPVTYAILHSHRNWFLDPDDFQKDNPNRIDYPPELEPPRGWAPLNECTGLGALKKQKEKLSNGVRTKGSYGTPDRPAAIEYGPSDDCHELTVLRCTFCRREYHGPNAKSMWRRHVYDKHKVAMKNRREGSAGSAVRSVVKKPKGKGTSDSFEFPSPTETSQNSLDLTNEQNIIRLLERVVSGDLQLNLPTSITGTGGGNNNIINLQSIANALQRSGITISLNENNSEVISSSQSEVTSSQSTESNDEVKQPTDEDSRKDDPVKLKHESEDIAETTETKSITSERTPLKDSTFSDRNLHNSAITPPGTPRKDKSKQKNILKSPATRLAQNAPLTPLLFSPSKTSFNHYYHRSLTSTAMRARALATTGHESYLTLLASSPSTTTNSPIKAISRISSPNRNRSSPFFRIKNRDSGTTSDDLGLLGISSPRFPFDLHMEPSDHPTYISTFDSFPLEVDSRGPTSSSTTSLAPPAHVDEKTTTRLVSTARASGTTRRDSSQAMSDEQESKYTPKYTESSPLQRVQRRRSSKEQEEEFDMDDFLDLKDSGTNLSSVPSSPHKVSQNRGFAKEFGLLSQEEVDRITASVRPGSTEDFRSPKRRRIETAT